MPYGTYQILYHVIWHQPWYKRRALLTRPSLMDDSPAWPDISKYGGPPRCARVGRWDWDWWVMGMFRLLGPLMARPILTHHQVAPLGQGASKCTSPHYWCYQLGPQRKLPGLLMWQNLSCLIIYTLPLPVTSIQSSAFQMSILTSL